MIARPIAGAPRPYRFPEFSHQRLDNGLGVWLVPLPDRELVSIHLLTDAGAASEDEAHAGLAGLTAQVLVTGTHRLDASAFAETTERLGIEVGSESSWDSARAGFTALGSKLDEGLALLAEMVRTPRLDAGEFDRIKSERLNDILQARADPGRLADESFLREVYADGEPVRAPVGRPPGDRRGAHRRGRARLPRQPLRAERRRRRHRRRHRARNRAARPSSGTSVTGAGPRRSTGPSSRPSAAARRIVLVDRPGSVQSELRVGHLGIDRYDPRYFPALVMAAMLGGVFGSRLNLRLREELGYTYSARSAFDPRRAVGPFTASAAVQTEVTVDAIRELLGQLERIREAPPDEAELAEVRDFLVGVFPLRFETTGGIASAIEPIAIYDLPHDWWQTYRAASRRSPPPTCIGWRGS